MSRFNTFVDFENEQHQDVVRILSDLGTSAYLYRQERSSSAGYEAEMSGYQYVGTILVYFHPMKPSEADTTDIGKISTEVSLGITASPVKVDDEIRFQNKVYRVARIDTQYTGKTEFVAERKI